jgi:hypothetical protein
MLSDEGWRGTSGPHLSPWRAMMGDAHSSVARGTLDLLDARVLVL